MPSPNFIRPAFMYRILTLLVVLCLAPAAVAQNAAPMAEQPPAQVAGQPLVNRSIQFSFDNADWKDVVPWFAEQVGYSWQKISEWPEDTFTLLDERKYTPMEALDQLNYALRLRKPAYTIVRNGSQLILTEATQPLADELIETITPDQLDERGAYEIVRCKFTVGGGIKIVDVEKDLRLSISQQYQRFIKVLPLTNEFYARETGGNLRKVRDTIVKITEGKASNVSPYVLKHFDPEQFLMVSRPLLGIDEGAKKRNDGSLIITIDPANNRFILKGTPIAIKEFENVAAVVDVAADDVADSTERPYLNSYPVFTDPEVAFKVIQTMLDGTDATVGQDTLSGAIILRGRKEHHKVCSDAIATLGGESGTTKIVQLENTSASSILSAIQSLMSSGTGLEGPSGPKLLANTVQNYIVIRGTPAEINDVTQMISQFDRASQLDPNRPRSNTRMLKMPASKRDDLLESAEDYMRSTGLKNRLKIIMPEDRKRSNGGGLRRFGSPGSNSRQMLSPPSAQPNDGAQTSRTASPRSALAVSRLLNFALTGLVAYQPQDEGVSNADYKPAETSSSIPGAPVIIKGTPFGILIESDDLDALDDLETLLASEAGEEGTDQGLTVFYLKFQKADTIKAAFDTMFGLGSGDSGGGGGDLVSGIVGNMTGEGAGDLLGGILGGGGTSSSGAVVTLEGDVQIGMFVPQNLLYISGATESDLEIIQDAIEIFDQPSPPQDPQLAGQTYAIPILHRDPEVVYELILKQKADLIQLTEQAQPQQQQGGNAQEQAIKAMRNIAGGAGKKNGGGQAQKDLAKARVDLDEQTNQILLTGPEFIYKEIRDFVEKVDQPQSNSVKRSRVLDFGVTEGMLKIIGEQWRGKIEMLDDVDEADAATPDAQKKTAGKPANNAAQEAATKRQEAAELFRNIRNQAQAGQRGGGQRGGGGGQRAGGNRGGGQRGGGRGGR